ncbi:bactofilin family protein [Enterobacter ludwigii]|uniref:bactofilin family protein n=2 Tax=Enterobacter ludwigii TaxID=299767 RepID=UPI001E5D924D|nr:polymer-forming cytoskeletal protein [Enterobacter ludwigii]
MVFYQVLWGVWFVWVVMLIKEIYPDIQILQLSLLLLSAFSTYFIYRQFFIRRVCKMQIFKRDSKFISESKDTSLSQRVDLITSAEENQSRTEDSEVIVSGVTRKNTFIALGVQLSGSLEGQGNIVIEGLIEGNVSGTLQVRVEAGGQVKGDIRASHIVINGYAEGGLYADTLTLQREGKIKGEINTDELIIEKGGVFIGTSQLHKSEVVKVDTDNVMSLKVQNNNNRQVDEKVIMDELIKLESQSEKMKEDQL